MPIYEYRCENCGKKSSFLIGVVSDSSQIVCPKCGGKDLFRVMSRVWFVRSEEEILEDMCDPSKIGDINDPKAIKQWAKKMGRELGDEIGEDFEEEMEKMEEEENIQEENEV